MMGMAVVFIAGIIIVSKPLPEGEIGFEAEVLADSMLAAVNEPAWSSLRYLAWTHDGKQHYVWDKWYHLVEIRVDDMRILLNTKALDGRVWRNDVQLEDEEKRKWLERAWKYWCNDSFWLNPIIKLRDDGTVRKLVQLKTGEDALLVTYEEGGATPGDSYLWIIDDEGMPVACRMWVKILPVKGIWVTWDDWIDVGGAQIATSHKIGPVSIEIGNVRTGDHHSDLGLDKDPFTDF